MNDANAIRTRQVARPPLFARLLPQAVHMSDGSVALTMINDMPCSDFTATCEVFARNGQTSADAWYDLRSCAANPAATRIVGATVIRGR